jgi:hypothetical protein
MPNNDVTRPARLAILAVAVVTTDAHAGPVYATWLGGSQNERTYAAAAGPGGTVYLAGRTSSPDFPFEAGGPITPTFPAGVSQSQPFVAGIAPGLTDNDALLFSDFLGGTLGDGGGEARGVAVDGAGNVYVVGFHTGWSLPVVGGFAQHPADHNNSFLVKLSPDGHTILYSTYIGGSGNVDEIDDLVVDDAGVATLAGRTASADFPIKGGFAPAPTSNQFDAVAMRIDTTKTGAASLLWSTCYGGSGSDAARSVAVGPGGRVYLTGSTSSYTVTGKLPMTANAFQPNLGGGDDAFVAVLDPSVAGSAALVYATYLGGPYTEEGGAIGVDAAGAVYATGATTSPSFPTTPGVWDTTVDQTFGPGTRTDAFLVRIDPLAAQPAQTLSWSTVLGGIQNETAWDLEVDGQGRPVIAGQSGSAELPRSACSLPRDAATTAYVARFTAGGQLEDSQVFGGLSNEAADGVALLAGGRFVIAGTSASPTLPVPAGVIQPARAGGDDAFVAILWDCASCPPGQALAGGTCAPCPAGTASPDGSACTPCVDGTIAPSAGSGACEPCGAGAAPTPDQTGCALCPPGSFSTDGVCAPCLPGEVAPDPGAGACTPCACGSAPDAEAIACSSCPAGTASPDGQWCAACAPGAVAPAGACGCQACPPGTSPSADGSTCVAACAPDRLASLVSPGLTPAFSPALTAYTIPPAPSSTTWVEATLCDPTLTLYVGGNQVVSGSKVGAWTANGKVDISLYAGWSQVATYTLTVDPGLPPAELADGLASLSTPGLAPGFAPAITDYTAPVQPGWLTPVTATVTDPTYTLYVDGVQVASGATFLTWAPPGSTIDVSVYLGWIQLGDYDVVVTP